MDNSGAIGLLLALSAILLGTLLLINLPVRRKVRDLLVVGLWLRVVGGLAYIFVIGSQYGGGDYVHYFLHGQRYAEWMLNGDWHYVLDQANWVKGTWWGTQFVHFVAGGVHSVVGSTIVGGSIVFAVAGYIGIVALGLAYKRAFPTADWYRYLVWIVLFPSLWFWPAIIGKDAIVLCGVGLATLGYVGKRDRVGWLLVAIGVFLVFAIRPQVAATFVFALVAGQWLGSTRRWSLASVFQGSLFLAAGIGVVTLSSGALGFELFSPEDVEGYLDRGVSQSAIGGGAVGGAQGGIAPWTGLTNTLFRPFIWEARGLSSLLAAIEVTALWGLAWYRRREIKAFVRDHRQSRLFWLGVTFVLIYATALGMSLGNLGIIARQRVHILPFLFLFMTGVAKHRVSRVRSGSRRAPDVQRVALSGA